MAKGQYQRCSGCAVTATVEDLTPPILCRVEYDCEGAYKVAPISAEDDRARVLFACKFCATCNTAMEARGELSIKPLTFSCCVRLQQEEFREEYRITLHRVALASAE